MYGNKGLLIERSVRITCEIHLPVLKKMGEGGKKTYKLD